MSPRIPLPPFPSGWYALCFSGEVPRQPREVRWGGRRLALWRAPDGTPHAEGRDGGPPVHLIERTGTLLGWLDPAGDPPPWEVPAADERGWSPYVGHCWPRLRTHPQETNENVVDIAHFTYIHRYRDVEIVTSATAEGPLLWARYAFTRSLLPAIPRSPAVRAIFTAYLYGLGYSIVEVEIPQHRMRTRQLVLATPVDDQHTDLRIAASVSLSDTVRAPLRAPAQTLVRAGLIRAYIKDVSDDIAIWEGKRHLLRPTLAPGDGPIHRYRRWASQFYTADTRSTAAS